MQFSTKLFFNINFLYLYRIKEIYLRQTWDNITKTTWFDTLCCSISYTIKYITYIILCYIITNEITINYSMVTTINDTFFPFLKQGGVLKIDGYNYIYLLKLKNYGGWINTCTCICTYICIIAYIGITLLLFIYKNIMLCILYILAYILVTTVYTKFWYKHIGFILCKYQNRNKKGLLYLYIDYIRTHYKYLLIKIIQIWIVSIIIITINRNVVKLFFENDSLTSSILIVILALPISLYIINILLKKIKKEKIEIKDFYLLNEYVVERVNFYRIFYLVSITIIYKKYYIYWINTLSIILPLLIIIMSIIILLIGASYINKIWKSSSSNLGKHNINRVYNTRKFVNLESKPEPLSTLVSSIVGVGGIYQVACNDGMNHFIEKGNTGLPWKKIFFNKPGKYYVNGTVNILQKPNDEMYVQSSEHESIIEEHKKYIDRSPILNMTYRQKNILKDRGNIPFSYFSNNDIFGSVAHVRKGNFLVINIIRKDWNASVFMPSYYLPEDTRPHSVVKMENALNFFEVKYNIILPIGKQFTGFIVYTQAESINTKGVFRHWRPSLDYVDPDFLIKVPNVKEYYDLDNFKIKRIKGFNNSNVINMLKYLTAKSLCDKSLYDRVNTEYLADKIYTNMLDYFLHKGRVYHKDKYLMHREGDWLNLEKELDSSSSSPQRDWDIIQIENQESIERKNIVKKSGKKKVRFVDSDKKEISEMNSKFKKLVFDRDSTKQVIFVSKKEEEETFDSTKPKKKVSFAEHTSEISFAEHKTPKDVLGGVPSEQEVVFDTSKPKKEGNFYIPRDTIKLLCGMLQRHRNNNASSNSMTDDYILGLRRNFHRDYSIWNRELNYSFYLRMEKTGLIEGLKSRNQQLGKWDEHFYVPLHQSRNNIWITVHNKYKYGIHSKYKVSNIYTACVTRLSFEFLEFRTHSNNNLYVNENSSKGTEVFSIIDVFNNNTICNVQTVMGDKTIMLPKHHYNFFNDKDEDSIRKILDFFYKSPDNNLVYKSDLKNEDLPAQEIEQPDKVPNKDYKKGAKDYFKKHIYDTTKQRKIRTKRWGKVTQEEIDAYINAKQTIRRVGGLGGMTSDDLLDRKIWEAVARTNIKARKVYQYKLKMGEASRFALHKASIAAKPESKQAIAQNEAVERAKINAREVTVIARIAGRNKITKRDAMKIAKIIEEEESLTAKKKASRAMRKEARELRKAARIEKKKKLAKLKLPPVIEVELIENLESDKNKTDLSLKTVAEPKFDTFWSTEDTGEINELVNIYNEPSISNNYNHQDDLSYLTIAGVEDENLFGSSMNEYPDVNYLSATGTDTLENEDIYSAD